MYNGQHGMASTSLKLSELELIDFGQKPKSQGYSHLFNTKHVYHVEEKNRFLQNFSGLAGITSLLDKQICCTPYWVFLSSF